MDDKEKEDTNGDIDAMLMENENNEEVMSDVDDDGLGTNSILGEDIQEPAGELEL